MENRIDDPGLPPADREPDAGLTEAGRAAGGPAVNLPEGGPAAADLSESGPAAADLSAGGPAAGGPAEARPAGQRPVTGEPRVDAALTRLDELADLPVTEHRAVFEHVHRSLSEVLGELDTGLPPGAGEGERSGDTGRSGGAESRRG
jgi:hypothetical protein